MAKKTNDEERLEPANMEKVIALLEPAEGKPITKKLACELLNISYNTTRLGTLIEKYKEKKAYQIARRAALRGKPATIDDVLYVIKDYLNGEPISAISEALYRSAGFVHKILEHYHVPIRASSHDYFRPTLIPEGAMRDTFNVGEIVYSARYDSTAKVEGTFVSPKTGETSYRIWLLSEKWKQFAYSEPCELASLQHLIELGVKI